METEARNSTRVCFGQLLHRIPVLIENSVNSEVSDVGVFCGFHELECFVKILCLVGDSVHRTVSTSFTNVNVSYLCQEIHKIDWFKEYEQQVIMVNLNLEARAKKAINLYIFLPLYVKATNKAIE